MKIGIYGGTFNPIHMGHIQLAKKAQTACGLDRVIFVPSGNSYMKSGVLAQEKRYEMVRLALQGIGSFTVSDAELRRTGPSYSYETLEEFHKLYPDAELFFLLGEDSLRQLETWKEPARLLKQCSLIAAGRPKEQKPDKQAQNNETKILPTLRQLAEYMERKYHTRIYCIEMNSPVSSSRIRKLASEGKPIDGMVPEAVRKLIDREHLYKL